MTNPPTPQEQVVLDAAHAIIRECYEFGAMPLEPIALEIRKAISTSASALQKRVQELERDLDGWRNREASVCSEDRSFEETIQSLRTTIAALTEEKAKLQAFTTSAQEHASRAQDAALRAQDTALELAQRISTLEQERDGLKAIADEAISNTTHAQEAAKQAQEYALKAQARCEINQNRVLELLSHLTAMRQIVQVILRREESKLSSDSNSANLDDIKLLRSVLSGTYVDPEKQAMRQALEAIKKSEELWEASNQVHEDAEAMGFDSDPTGSMHATEAHNQAVKRAIDQDAIAMALVNAALQCPPVDEYKQLQDKLYLAQEACNEVAAYGDCHCENGGGSCPFCLCDKAAEGFQPRQALKSAPGQELMGDNRGVALIAEERARQISVEGWTTEHDNGHFQGEMAAAASCYAVMAHQQARQLWDHEQINEFSKVWWPWAQEWWKPSDNPIRNLTKAGALIAAEIDRLQRQAIDSAKKGEE